MATSFGVTSTGGYGVLQSVTTRSTAEIAEARSALGAVTDQKAYSHTKEVSFEAVYSGSDPAVAGTLLTIGGITNGVITSSETRETNTDYKRISCTVQKKDSATCVAQST